MKRFISEKRARNDVLLRPSWLDTSLCKSWETALPTAELGPPERMGGLRDIPSHPFDLTPGDLECSPGH